MKFDELGAQLESYWKVYPPVVNKDSILERAALSYQAAGNTEGELRTLSQAFSHQELSDPALHRYLDLLLAKDPERLAMIAGDGAVAPVRDAATNAAVSSGNSKLALEVTADRGHGLPPVWTRAYTGLVGLTMPTLRQRSAPRIRLTWAKRHLATESGRPWTAISSLQETSGSTTARGTASTWRSRGKGIPRISCPRSSKARRPALKLTRRSPSTIATRASSIGRSPTMRTRSSSLPGAAKSLTRWPRSSGSRESTRTRSSDGAPRSRRFCTKRTAGERRRVSGKTCGVRSSTSVNTTCCRKCATMRIRSCGLTFIATAIIALTRCSRELWRPKAVPPRESPGSLTSQERRPTGCRS